MSIQLTGVLNLPLTNPSGETSLRFTATSNSLTVLLGSMEIFTTDAVGNYNFSLEFGTYKIEVLYDNQWHWVAHVQVDATVPTPTDLGTLINDYSTPGPCRNANEQMFFKGYWDAGLNIPELPDPNELYGDYWIVSGAGTQDLGQGDQDFTEGDRLLYDGVMYTVLPFPVNLSASDAKTLYESNPDTNAYDDAAKSKVDNITVTQTVNLDNMESDLSDAVQVTDQITVTSPIDLDLLSTQFTGVKAKVDLMTITLPVNLDDVITALQPGDNVSELVNDAGYLTSNAVISVAERVGEIILVKADITDLNDADYATAAQGLLADTALQDLTGSSVNELSDVDLSGIGVGDYLVWNGSSFGAFDVSLDIPVDSVAGKTGIVILEKADITDFSDFDYATAAQGLLADSAVQPADNVSSLTNDAGYLSTISWDGVATVATSDIGLLGNPVINGYATADNDRVAVINQNNPWDNGIYIVSVGPWLRAPDANTDIQFKTGKVASVLAGDYIGHTIQYVNPDDPNLGVDSLSFELYVNVQTTDDLPEGVTNLYMTVSEQEKLDNITVTQPVDLDAMEALVDTALQPIDIEGMVRYYVGTPVAMSGESTVIGSIPIEQLGPGLTYLSEVEVHIKGLQDVTNYAYVGIYQGLIKSLDGVNSFSVNMNPQITQETPTNELFIWGVLNVNNLDIYARMDGGEYNWIDFTNGSGTPRITISGSIANGGELIVTGAGGGGLTSTPASVNGDTTVYKIRVLDAALDTWEFFTNYRSVVGQVIEYQGISNLFKNGIPVDVTEIATFAPVITVIEDSQRIELADTFTNQFTLTTTYKLL